MSKEIEDCDTDDIRTGTSDSILAALYRRIERDCNIDLITFERALDRYVNTIGIPRNIKAYSSTRCNLHSELKSETMSWKTFIKSFVFLTAESAEITFRLNREGHDPLLYTYVLNVKDPLLIESLSPKTKKNDPAKVKNMLSVIYKNILEKAEISPALFSKYVEDYVQSLVVDTGSKNKSLDKGNTKKDLLKNEMTWRNFIKGLIVINVKDFDMEVKLSYNYGRSSLTGINVILL